MPVLEAISLWGDKALICVVLTSAVCIIWTMLILRTSYAHHANLLWQTFFFVFVPGFMVSSYLFNTGNPDPAIARALKSWLVWSQDIRGEANLLAVMLTVLIVPQYLAFGVSGIFGCASRPIFVKELNKFAMVSIVKALCVLSAVQAATLAFYYWDFGNSLALMDEKTHHIRSIASQLYLPLGANASMALCAAFVLSLIHYNAPSVYAVMISSKPGEVVLTYMTRYTSREKR
jgi:hypothetical protein